MTWVQRHVDERGRLWAVVVLGPCPWASWESDPRCPFATEFPHAHHLPGEGSTGIITEDLRAIGALPR